MKFKSTTIKGAGRGKGLGFPTINMVVPADISLTLQRGIYAVRVFVNEQDYNGALYFGPASTFGETVNQLEVYLLNEVMVSVNPGEEIEIEIVGFVRTPENFSSPELLVLKMAEDVEKVRGILKI